MHKAAIPVLAWLWFFVLLDGVMRVHLHLVFFLVTEPADFSTNATI